MYAIIKNGGKQYKVKEGEVVKLERFDLGIGEKVEFDTVLIGQTAAGEVKIGAPTVTGAKVVGEVVEQGRYKKVKIMKFRRRKHSMKQQGHRQYFTVVKVSSISL
ncbi:50S ribosomal protein L21 [Francisella persica ATCC VR-331]|uniref:Large ribosomal subunit protein bL21 n=1 Tax=Francisella persica ATCC VR-331 TaxID=1086726 RepID=A0AAC8VE14_9GAMM|nr:50S ribosomal protein L21 [Francisella persica]ALB01690.1 50S ribosomal protein L21 [Francisella persica ATCC VR-331]ANH77989.1 50S ribosomal protein L21 [Francisella persica ATCC VR-331]